MSCDGGVRAVQADHRQHGHRRVMLPQFLGHDDDPRRDADLDAMKVPGDCTISRIIGLASRPV